LKAWLAATAIVATVVIGALLIFQFATPMPSETDTKFFRAQAASLQSQERSFRAQGLKPLSIIFLGTSRFKNVAMKPDQIAAAAKAAGIRRPVASTFLAINWGGFERLSPGARMLKKFHPDVVVMMPELFFEDFNRVTRVQLGFRYLQSKLWGQEYYLFGDYEFREPVCWGFKVSPEQRLSISDRWISKGTEMPGPGMARETAKRLAAQGTLVLIADVPVSKTLLKYRPDLGGASFFKRAGFSPSTNLAGKWIGHPLPDESYCDWAHISPDRAHEWQNAFFGQVAEDLNRID